MSAAGGLLRSAWRLLWRAIGALMLLVLVAALAAVVVGWRSFGKGPEGERRARMERSPQWDAAAGRFKNPQPLVNDVWLTLVGWLDRSQHLSPKAPLAVDRIDPRRFDTPPASGLRVTWLGHASMLIELDGARLLTDPMWSERASPVPWVGPRRWYDPPIALADLPRLDAVLISHDHYDHLDRGSIEALAARDTTFIVPLGVGAHLAYWGVPESRIVERDWWDRTKVGPIEIVTTPARHASGRTGLDQDRTLWAGYALVGPSHRMYFSGDTGFFPAMRDIGERLGPFDLTSIESGQYHAAWPDWHIGPERAVQAHQVVRGRVMLPVHWALLTLAYHGWTEPIERVLSAADKAGVTVLTPKPGQSVEPPAADAAAQQAPATLLTARWWPEVPWVDAAHAPLHSTGTGD